MGIEIDLLKNYPRTKRNLEERGATKTDQVRKIARAFGSEFFDGDRQYGYGGFRYSPHFWQPVIPTFREHFRLTAESTLLDVGCAKGFMMHDFAELIPGITVKGVDVSHYAIENVMEDMRPHVQVADAVSLPFPNKSFDIVVSINTIHNLDRDGCAKALQEIERISKKGAFVTVDAYRNELEKERMFAWNLTAKTIMSVDEWVAFFKEVGYSGDYFWFIP